MTAEPRLDDDAVELDDGLMAKLSSRNGYDAPTGPTESAARPFQSLWETNPREVARQLERQHPQATALVIAHFPPDRAAAVLECLAPKLQADVLRRVAELGPADPEVVRVVEIELEQLLSNEINAARNRSSGLLTVAAIVKAAGGRRDNLLGNLERHHSELAQQLEEVVPADAGPSAGDSHTSHAARREIHAIPASSSERNVNADQESDDESTQDSPTISLSRDQRRGEPDATSIEFEELMQLADQDWATLIRSLDPQLVLLALAGASEQLVERIARQLPAAEANIFRRRLEQVGPVQLADIDRAQYHVALRASQLAAQALIRIPSRKTFAAAA